MHYYCNFPPFLSGNLEFSDGFVRLNKINRQTNLISSPKPNPHPSNHRASLGNNNNGPTHLILLEVKHECLKDLLNVKNLSLM